MTDAARRVRVTQPSIASDAQRGLVDVAREALRVLLAAETMRYAMQRPGPLPPLLHERARGYARAHRAEGTPVEKMVVELKHLLEASGVDAFHGYRCGDHAEQLFRWCLGAYFSED